MICQINRYEVYESFKYLGMALYSTITTLILLVAVLIITLIVIYIFNRFKKVKIVINIKK